MRVRSRPGAAREVRDVDQGIAVCLAVWSRHTRDSPIGVKPRVARGSLKSAVWGARMAEHIRNPIEWGGDQIRLAALTVRSLARSVQGSQAPPAVRRIKAADLRDVLVRGLGDFGSYRTDVIFICLIYPVVGILLTWLIFGYQMLPLLFPLAAGFALVGPVAAVGLYEMSRRREQGIPITWVDAFSVIRSPGFGAVVVLGCCCWRSSCSGCSQPMRYISSPSALRRRSRLPSSSARYSPRARAGR